jgi:hypothetical protein
MKPKGVPKPHKTPKPYLSYAKQYYSYVPKSAHTNSLKIGQEAG